MKTKITVLGAGRMGSALVTAFLKQGHPVTVWNRTAAKTAPLAAQGARVAATVREAVVGADIVIGNVADYPTSKALVQDADVTKELRGKLFVELTTGTPKQAKEVATWAREHRIDYLDGAIMATPNFIGQPGCTILYSGSRELFDKHLADLQVLGDNTIFAGADIGHANALDASLLIGLWGALFGVLQGTAVAEAEKLPLRALAGALKGFMPVIEESILGSIDRVERDALHADAATTASADTCHTSVRLIQEITKEHGIDSGVPDAMDRLFQKAHALGWGQGDFAAVYKAFR